MGANAKNARTFKMNETIELKVFTRLVLKSDKKEISLKATSSVYFLKEEKNRLKFMCA